MGLAQQVQQVFIAGLNSSNQRRVVIPAGAAVAVVSDGAAAANAYAPSIQIVAAAVLTDPTWLGGVEILFNDLEAACYADLNIGTGIAPAITSLAEFSYFNELVAGAGIVHPVVSYEMKYPIIVTGSPGLVGRIRKSSAASAKGITPKVIFYNALGT